MGTPALSRRRMRRSASSTSSTALRASDVATLGVLAVSGSGQRPGAVCGTAGGWLRCRAAGLVTQAGESWE
ncbi:hypothetical protein [Adonisia turfae]